MILKDVILDTQTDTTSYIYYIYMWSLVHDHQSSNQDIEFYHYDMAIINISVNLIYQLNRIT